MDDAALVGSEPHLAGLGIGAIADHENKDKIPVSEFEFRQLTEGESVKVSLNDGDKFQGKFINYSRPDSFLVIQTSDQPHGDGEFMPEIIPGDMVRIHMKSIKSVETGMSNTGKSIGVLAGALVDLGIIVAFQSTNMGP